MLSFNHMALNQHNGSPTSYSSISHANANCANAFGLNFTADFEEIDTMLMPGSPNGVQPYASLTEDNNLPTPATATAAAHENCNPTSNKNSERRDASSSASSSSLSHSNPVQRNSSQSSTIASVTLHLNGCHASLKQDQPLSPFSMLTGGPSLSDQAVSPGGHGCGFGTATMSGSSDCSSSSGGSTTASATLCGSRVSDKASHTNAGKNKNFFEKITCLPENNYNVLTPDKHVMLSIPAQYIVPTNGSRNYGKKNRTSGSVCTADEMDTNSRGNTVGTPDSTGDGKKMFFSFCLCKSFSVKGGRCHHGADCDFIHCLPEKLPHVVSTDSGKIIDEIIERKSRSNVAGGGKANQAMGVSDSNTNISHSNDAVIAPSAAGEQGRISTFQVHWSTPVASLETSPYARLPPGHVIYIKKENSRGNLQAIPSEFVYKTIGGVEAVKSASRNASNNGTNSDIRGPLRICKHYEREKCARGPLCHFIHPVVLAESGQPNKFSAFIASQKMQYRQGQARLHASQALVAQQQQQRRLQAGKGAHTHGNAFPRHEDVAGVPTIHFPTPHPVQPQSPPPPPPPPQLHQQPQVESSNLNSDVAVKLMTLLAQMQAINSSNVPPNVNGNHSRNMGNLSSMVVVTAPDGTFRVVPANANTNPISKQNCSVFRPPLPPPPPMYMNGF